MNKKFNLKLTLLLVSLFIGLILMAFGNMNRYCLSFGLAILGGTIAMWGILDMLAKDEEILEYEKAMYEEDKDEDDIEI